MCDMCDTAIQEICGYQLSCWKIVGTFFLVLITAGLILVLITWRKDIKVHPLASSFELCFQYTLLYREAKLVDADKVLLTDHNHHQVHEESVIRWVKKNSVRFVEFVVLLIWNYVPDFNPSCFS